MSTAGKVLVVLVMLSSLVWIVLSAGVSQLNTNGNRRLHELSEQIEKLQANVKQVEDDIVSQRRQTTSVQEAHDRRWMVLRSRQSDIEKARSQIRENLSRNQYQLAIVQETIDKAKAALQHRVEEQQNDDEALAKAKTEVKDLAVKSNELLSQLLALRQEFQSRYHANLESLGKTR